MQTSHRTRSLYKTYHLRLFWNRFNFQPHIHQYWENRPSLWSKYKVESRFSCSQDIRQLNLKAWCIVGISILGGVSYIKEWQMKIVGGTLWRYVTGAAAIPFTIKYSWLTEAKYFLCLGVVIVTVVTVPGHSTPLLTTMCCSDHFQTWEPTCELLHTHNFLSKILI